MALIACGECGEKISDQASACPHCGARRASARSQKLANLISLCAAIAAGLFVAIWAVKRG